MSTYTQDTRRLGVLTPLGKDVVLLQAFEGKESLSELFMYQLDLLSENDDIDPRELIGKPVSYWVEYQDGERRYFHGIINQFEYLGRGDRLSIYQAIVVPWLWLLDQNQDCRIFQEMSIPDIIADVFRQAGFTDFEMSGIKSQYAELEYCVQYNESDFDFVSRLMEEAGIFYFFHHEEGKHTLKLVDSTISCKECRDDVVNCEDVSSQRHSHNEVWDWKRKFMFLPGKCAQSDYNFKNPQASLLAQSETLMDVPSVKKFEIFEFPGRYQTSSEGGQYAKRRMEAIEAGFDIIYGKSFCRSFSPGSKFKIGKHHHRRECQQNFIVKTVHHTVAATGQFTTGAESEDDGYENEFECIPESAPFRPERSTPRPSILGTQTARVVGPEGEEIYTDEHGRVKVQFHWDRRGKRDENSSCWIRVSQVHAGQGWGMMDLPRIGEEVIVSFLEGDPDRPIIVGRVYNGVNTPPFKLPDQKTRRGNMTKSHQGTGYNEISMDDTAGKEQVRVNAQYDMNSVVGNDQTLAVGNDRTDLIGNNDSLTVANNRTASIGVDQSESVGANHSQSVGANQTVSVGANQTTSVGSMQNTSVGMTTMHNSGLMAMHNAGVMQTINGGIMTIVSAGVELKLVGPGGTISIGPGGIHIKGKVVTIEGGTVNINP